MGDDRTETQVQTIQLADDRSTTGSSFDLSGMVHSRVPFNLLMPRRAWRLEAETSVHTAARVSQHGNSDQTLCRVWWLKAEIQVQTANHSRRGRGTRKDLRRSDTLHPPSVIAPQGVLPGGEALMRRGA